jgi:colanic acid/amylovoran biosynthesis glycosyltransferase
MTRKVAYIVSRFPKISETFILREMIAIEQKNWDVSLFPLIVETPPVIHPEAELWLSRLHYYPWLSLDIIAANLLQFLKTPFLYTSLWYTVIRENHPSLKFLARAILILPKAVRMAAEMSRNGILHIHAHYATHPALVAWIVHKLTGISYSVTVHAHDIFVDRSMIDLKLRDAVFVAAISEYNREFLVRHLGEWVREKTHIVHCGIQPELYTGLARIKNNSRFDIVSIGSLQPYKGMQYLILACVLLRARGIPFYCRIIGDGVERPMLEELIAQNNLSQSVDLLGAMDQANVASILREAQVYVQSSVITPSGKMEGIPVSIMEAFATGIPVIASRISGIPELVISGETGYLVPPADVEALAEMLEHIYHNPVEANSLAKAGQEKVLHEFELSGNAQKLSLLFQQTIATTNTLKPGI